MQRVIFKNAYIDNYLTSLDQSTCDSISDTYQKACSPLFSSQISTEMQKIKSEFLNDNLFLQASDYCKAIREKVKTFEEDVMVKDMEEGSFNRDLWVFRTEEVFMLKLFCLEGAKQKDDALLMGCINYMKVSGNVKYAFFMNFGGLSYNSLQSALLPVQDNALLGKIKYKLIAKKATEDNSKMSNAIVTLQTENKVLKEENRKLTGQVETLHTDREEWKGRMEALMKMQLQMKKDLEELKAKKLPEEVKTPPASKIKVSDNPFEELNETLRNSDESEAVSDEKLEDSTSESQKKRKGFFSKGEEKKLLKNKDKEKSYSHGHKK